MRAAFRQSPLQVMERHSSVMLAVVPSGLVARIFTYSCSMIPPCVSRPAML